MKKIFTCLLLFVFAITGRGQDYLPMLSANTCWVRQYVDNISVPPIVEPGGFYHIFTNSTEVISDMEYVKLFNEYDPVLEDEPIGYLREDTDAQQVFYLNASEEFTWLNCGGEEILLYDFSAGVGDTVYHCPNSDLYYVVQSAEIVGEYTSPEIDFFGFGGGRVYEVYSSAFNFSTIYEGVGTNIGPIHEPYNVSTPGSEILDSYMFGCAFIVSTDDFGEDWGDIYPNPVQDVLTIQIADKSNLSKVRIYDLSGRILVDDKLNDDNFINVANLTSGLYFITGYDKEGKQIFTQKFIKSNSF